jgi:TolB-like protein/DNA-binding winged helix-turn-helix (wHTH) protein
MKWREFAAVSMLYFTRGGSPMPLPQFEFGEFRLDCGRFELLRQGRAVKLERKPMELLILLAQSDGTLVTRTEIAERLWESEVFVDTEHGINTAIRKIRHALRDDPEVPRFIQTVTGMGYRFIAPISRPPVESIPSRQPPEPQPASIETSAEQAPAPPANKPQPARRQRHALWLTLAIAALAGLLLALTVGPHSLATRLLHRGDQSSISSLAVLPLDNLSGDPAQNYFADGMTDELITMLAKSSTLRIVSRTSVMQYKGVHRPLREIAGELGVDAVLEGSVVRSGDRVHLNVQLIHAGTDTHLWAESYDRDANSVAALPAEAARTIAARLGRAATTAAPARYVRPEAHDAYLRGIYIWYSGPNEEAGPYFRRATELQPDYAKAWTGLSNYYSAGAIEGDINPVDALPQGQAAATRAVELDDTLPEAHLAMAASVFINHWDWKWSEQEIARAIQLNPQFAEAYHLHAKMLGALNRQSEAIAEQKRATELDPFSRPWALVRAFSVARQYDAALSDAKLRLESYPRDPTLFYLLYDVYRCMGMQKEAAHSLVQSLDLSGDPAGAAAIQRAYKQGGYKAVLRSRLDQFAQRSRTHYVSPVDEAELHAQLSEREQTLALLEEGYRQHSPLLLWIQCDPAYDFLHADPRYRSLIQRIGLPPAW